VTGIDWSAQLKKIERQFEGLPPEPSESEQRAKRENERRQQLRHRNRETLFGAVSRVVLVLSLGLAMSAWPYGRACGAGLLGYLAASAAIIAGGVWATIGTWRSRSSKLHGVALLAVAWGVVLITAQVLPRVGYAKIDPQNGPAWRCWRPDQASVGVPTVNGLWRRGVR
jgi:cation transport ATPase